MKKAHLHLVEAGSGAQAPDWLTSLEQRFTAAQVRTVRLALEFAAQAYGGRRAAGGGPLLDHAVDAAGILAGLRLDDQVLAAAILFPALEAAPETATRIRESF
ncbi:MAG: HD domain-containing protein, partial [Betaproteobacteria bacterium]|nr:HD domain-containing protein [Betaproteobacteria bacterium]